MKFSICLHAKMSFFVTEYSHAEMRPWVWLVCVCVQVMSIMTRPTNLTLQWYQWVHMWEQTVQIIIRKCTYWFTHVKKWRSHKTNPIMTRSWYISTLSVTYCILQFCSWHANSRATTNSFMVARPNCFKTGCGQRHDKEHPNCAAPPIMAGLCLWSYTYSIPSKLIWRALKSDWPHTYNKLDCCLV